MKKDEILAEQFHNIYERLAPEYDYKTRKASAVAWEDVPKNNKALMIAVCGEIFNTLPDDREIALRSLQKYLKEIYRQYKAPEPLRKYTRWLQQE